MWDKQKNSLIKYVMNSAEIKNKQSFIKTFQQTFPDSLGEKTMTTFADICRAEGRTEGRTEGRIEGIREGALQGERILLIKLLTHRFGYLSKDVLDRIEKADSNILFVWGERVLDVETLDDVFE